MPKKVEASERVLKADLVLLAMGFLGPENTIVEELGLDPTPGALASKPRYANFKTSVDKVFAAGGGCSSRSIHSSYGRLTKVGQSARECDRFLMGSAQLP